ncbi:MAG: zinc dependent phospholipase C family protein, partial [Methanocellales archaeon]|nr:zinc dependent phospholipase C family protein [Methanocellales archaeon]
LVAYLLVKVGKIEKYPSLIYLGTILPDVLTRFNDFLMHDFNWFFTPLHTPLVMFLTCLLITYLFEENRRKMVFISLMIGSFLHLFLDVLQIHWVTTYYLFYPFSWEKFEFGLFWPHQSIYFIPVLLLMSVIILLRK